MSGFRNLLAGGILAAVACGTRLARAQDRPDPATDPALNDPSLDERVRDLERRTRPIAPSGVAPAGAPPDTEPAKAPGAPLRREGTFLVRQRGSLVKLRGGEWAFVFHRDPRGQAERPMILLRSQHLARMQQLAGRQPDAATFLVSGQVFAYRGVNYLLVAPTPPVLAQPDAAGEPPKTPDTPSPRTGDPAAADPSTGELLKQLEAQRDRPRALGLPQAPDAAAGGGAPPATLPEGTVISRRRCRLVRGAGGETAVAFDNDTDGAANVDPAMVLLPCLTLERMEQVATDRGENLLLQVSGRVFTYEGRNYLMPTMFQLYPWTDMERRQ